MKVIALGTGTSQGIPIIGCQCKVCQSTDPRDHRLRSSVYVESSETKILIDIGPDFRQQFLANKLTTIDMILITHEHNDHIIGLDDIRAINFTQNKSIPIYAHKRVLTQIRERFAYIFNQKPYPGIPKVELHEISDSPFQFNDITITPINIEHGSIPIYGFRLDDFTYITDANRIPEAEYTKIKNSKVLIINALRREEHYSHFNLDEALIEVKKINPDSAYLTHLSHRMGLTSEWSQQLPKRVRPLNDKMEIEI